MATTETRVVKIKRTVKGKSFRLFDFNFYDQRHTHEQSSTDDDSVGSDQKKQKYTPHEPSQFVIQMFGINEKGETCCLYVDNFSPFFFLKVGNDWNKSVVADLLYHIKGKVGKYHAASILSAELLEAHKLYGFTGGKLDKFAKITFRNMSAFNKVKNLWFEFIKSDAGDTKKMIPFIYKGIHIELYESFLPPLLRYFHVQNISPSGWVLVKTDTAKLVELKTTTCKYEYSCKVSDLIPQKKDVRVPYKICSFDIEASSSHGDFPLPKKTYKRLAIQMIDVFNSIMQPPNPELDETRAQMLLKRIVLTAFGHDKLDDIDLVYPKVVPSKEEVLRLIQILQNTPIKNAKSMNEREDNSHLLEIDKIFERIKEDTEKNQEGDVDGDDEDEAQLESAATPFWAKGQKKPKVDGTLKLVEVLIADKTKFPRDVKIDLANDVLTMLFPRLEGDKCTFIGSTFMRYGDVEPYLNHCVVLGTCDPVEGATIATATSEHDLLIQWRDLIQSENPDIIIGYNIFGFDYEFLFRRAEENGCEREFLKLSRKEGEICAKPLRTEYGQDPEEMENAELNIENPPPIKLATGEYHLRFVKMTGRLQIDLFVYFRRSFNLPSYKLDDVAGQNISDDIKRIEHVLHPVYGATTELFSGNMKGLHAGDFIHIEISGFTSDYYKNGQKFRVLEIQTDREITETIKGVEKTQKYNVIVIQGTEAIDMTKHMKWGMAKDDVSPQDIFRLANGSSADRAIVAKYCIQDCNLVHHLMNKIDLITGYTEMSTICSVPISFLILRGQSIKLTSYVAKKCREKNTLMPDLEKSEDKDKYEGAIVLPPKCSMYMDNPVACVDYASLYPSSMISQNFSHDSKVWVKEYDLNGKLVNETGEKNKAGEFIYDNLPGYKYIDIVFDNFKNMRDPARPKSKEVRTKVGHFICRWAQLPDGEKSILPSILEELLKARASTRKIIKTEKDPFMQNILEKRQLGYKETANSLYGQCGAKVSSFYEKDVAACTTATGRMMITYAKRIIEEVYGNLEYDTEVHGPVKCKAEYVYGDSVANYTPVYVRVGGKFDICTIANLATKYGADNWVKCVEPGKQDKEFCELSGVETWSDKGWTRLHRVIRHELGPKKKMIRILTHSGLVDATDDHSLLRPDGTEVSPTDVREESELMHFPLPRQSVLTTLVVPDMCENDYTVLNNAEDSLSFFKNNQLKIAQLYWYATNNGWHCTISNHDNSYLLNINKNAPKYNIRNANRVKSIFQIPYSGYVYDLTTDNHHFSAGIGSMVVHNTDSVFFTFNLENIQTGEKIRGKPALEITIEIAQDVAKLCTKYLKPPMELSYEKTLMPFILLSKKRYVGMLYETDANKGKMKYMGLSIKRRDSCDYLKDTYGGILNILMREYDIQKAIHFFDQSMENLIAGNVSMEKLMLTKQLKSEYKNPMQQAHWVLSDRIGKRDPGNKPKSGDRMKYLFICNPNKGALQGEKIETPEYIIANSLKIDYMYYITNQLMKPLQQLFGLALEQIWEYQKKPGAIKTYKKDIEKLESEFPDLEIFAKKREKHCSKKVEELLFKKFLTRINNETNKLQTISSFFVKK
jgi:DNA polymerase elongation subunit (family B)